jgi:8-oxo-dGTP diphosphatase
VARSNPRAGFRHEALATVFRITDGRLTVLVWRRPRDPYRGTWALPSGPVGEDETLGACVARELAAKVDLNELAHLEQLETRSDPGRDPFQRTIATAYLGLVPVTADPCLPEHAGWHPVDALPELAFDHGSVIASAVERLRHKISYSNLAFALAPAEFTLAQLRDLYAAVLGRPVSVTNLQRVLQRRGQLEPTGAVAPATRSGGRPPMLYRFTERRLMITDPFAALRPAQRPASPG